jgi:predicted nuclease of predicted toxin-antitoxin system
VRFLVDQNVPVQVAEALRQAGHLAEHTRERGLSRADDEQLLSVARVEGSAIVTFDSDFARFLALSGDESPSILHVRVGPEHLPELPQLVIAAVDETEANRNEGAVVVLEPERVRWRPLPIR